MSVTHLTYPEQIQKRDGRIVVFDINKIENAISKCYQATLGYVPIPTVQRLAVYAVNLVAAKGQSVTVENVQDAVEVVLQAEGEYECAKNYILYRAEHAKSRDKRPIPDEVKQAFTEDEKYFPTQLQKFQFYDKYSRFNYELGRRETWVETVNRATDYLYELSKGMLDREDYEAIRKGMLEMKALPSMRLLAMAGEAARRQNIAIYNCSYMPVDSIDSFVEALLISMAGCGVGFSVESKYVENLPRVKRQTDKPVAHMAIGDTTEGWAKALKAGIENWINGREIIYDFSLLRPAGSPLKIKGGRASGPGPFKAALNDIRAKILARQGSYLRPIDAHDIMCLVGNAAVSGGVRRTAMISLFDYEDNEMRNAKTPGFDKDNSQRWNANNSFVWPEKDLTQAEFISNFMEMVRSGNGEPGIFNRKAAQEWIPERRAVADFGTNPCGEIILRPFQFCNLSIAVARADDTHSSLDEKIKLATLIGTIQSMATHFPGLRSVWAKNCEEERLLGVDINGQMDSPICFDKTVRQQLWMRAMKTNHDYSERLGIPHSAAVTCVKPSGNSSQLLNCSSGLHARWSPYYIRNVRVGTHSPIYKVMRDAGVPMSPENGQEASTANTFVAHFPVKAPEGAKTRKDFTAIQQCEFWALNKEYWTEHNPSVTITYKPDEVLDLMKWVWEHRDMIGGMTFLPADDAQYSNMPYVEITKEEYEATSAIFPKIDFSKIYRYEEEDLTTAAQELACVSGLCEIDFTVKK